jgi:hypothetical protein
LPRKEAKTEAEEFATELHGKDTEIRRISRRFATELHGKKEEE